MRTTWTLLTALLIGSTACDAEVDPLSEDLLEDASPRDGDEDLVDSPDEPDGSADPRPDAADSLASPLPSTEVVPLCLLDPGDICGCDFDHCKCIEFAFQSKRFCEMVAQLTGGDPVQCLDDFNQDIDACDGMYAGCLAGC